jgi:hypothetical protein
MSLDDEVYTQPVQRETRLILLPDESAPYTAVRETDARTALLRGLREYIENLSYDAPGGAHFRFLKVEETWPEPDQNSKYPSASLYTEEPGVYDASGYTPSFEQLPDGRVLQASSEFTQSITVDLWCTNATERMGLIAMLEDAFDPVDWMSGFRLRLPHYFNAVGTFLKMNISVVDSTENANRRWRLASMTLQASVTQLRMVGALPGLELRIAVETIEADLSGTVTPPIEGITVSDLAAGAG